MPIGLSLIVGIFVVKLVAQEHAGETREVAEEETAKVHQTALANPWPWGMANSKKDGMVLNGQGAVGHRKTLAGRQERSSLFGRHSGRTQRDGVLEMRRQRGADGLCVSFV